MLDGFTRFLCGFEAIRAVMSLFPSTLIGFTHAPSPKPLPTPSLPPPHPAPTTPTPTHTPHAPRPPQRTSNRPNPPFFTPRSWQKQRWQEVRRGGGGRAGRVGRGDRNHPAPIAKHFGAPGGGARWVAWLKIDVCPPTQSPRWRRNPAGPGQTMVFS